MDKKGSKSKRAEPSVGGVATSGGEGAGKGPAPNTPYSTAARRERSRELAQKRRTTYKSIMDDLTQVKRRPL